MFTTSRHISFGASCLFGWRCDFAFRFHLNAFGQFVANKQYDKTHRMKKCRERQREWENKTNKLIPIKMNCLWRMGPFIYLISDREAASQKKTKQNIYLCSSNDKKENTGVDENLRRWPFIDVAPYGDAVKQPHIFAHNRIDCELFSLLRCVCSSDTRIWNLSSSAREEIDGTRTTNQVINGMWQNVICDSQTYCINALHYSKICSRNRIVE